MRKIEQKMVLGYNSVATKISDSTLPLSFGSSSKSSPPTPHIKPMQISDSQNGRYVKLQIIGWNGIWWYMACASFCVENIFAVHLYMPYQSAKISFSV